MVYYIPTIPTSHSSASQSTDIGEPPVKKKREYIKRKESYVCKKCNQPKGKNSNTGHDQFGGIVYCPNTERISVEEWKKIKREEKSKKK